MKVIEWRSRGERWLTGRRQAAVATRGPGPVAQAWERVHDAIMDRRVGGRAAPLPGLFTVSVGNLALGGTGKTPVVLDLAAALAAAGHVGAVVTRGFGSDLTGPLVVGPSALRAGDEARLMARALARTSWSVVQARSRAAGVARAAGLEPAPRICLLEDGHQTAGVGRHLDVLIVDHWTSESVDGEDILAPRTGAVFPLGAWREGRNGARRAQVILVETDAEVPARGPQGQPVLAFRRRSTLRQVAGRPGPAEDAGLLAGIARPEKFEAQTAALLASPPRLAIRSGDHAPYAAASVDRIVAALREACCRSLVTTAKDWVKLEEVWPSAMPAHVVDLELTWGRGQALADVVGERLAMRQEEAPD